MPLLWRRHGDHRDLRALVSASGTACSTSVKPGERSWPGMKQYRSDCDTTVAACWRSRVGRPPDRYGTLAGPRLPPQAPLRRPLRRPVRPSRIASRTCSVPLPSRPDPETSIAPSPWLAGSFFGDFRAPIGSRNPSRKRAVRFHVDVCEKRTLVAGYIVLRYHSAIEPSLCLQTGARQ